MGQRMTADDLFTGLFGALAEMGFTSFSIRTDRLDQSVKAVYDRLLEHAHASDLNLRFTVRPNELGESAVVREALANAALRNLVSIDNPEFQHIRLQPDKLRQLVDLERLPGGSKLYRELAANFVTQYEGTRLTAPAS